MNGSAVSSVRLLLLLLALLTASCTVPNPDYDPGGGSDGMPLIPVSDLGLPVTDAPGADGPPTTTPKPVGVDVLLVVDNSQGMSHVQKQLAADIEELISGLDKLPGGPDYRLGVVTTDVGVGGFATSSCSPGGDEGRLKVPPGCPLSDGRGFLEMIGGAKNTPLPAHELAACLVQQGMKGCGFEQPLEALRLALGGANKDFLRPGAALAVLVVTSEDDCSAKSKGLFDFNDGTLGPYADYRCFQHGVLCAGKQPPLAAGTVSGCLPGQTWLQPVSSRYVGFLQGLRPAGWVKALVLAAPTQPSYQVSKSYDGYGYPLYRLEPSCSAPGQVQGTAGIRLASFAQGLGGLQGPICAASYRPYLAQLAARIKLLF